jgi:phosphoribosylamine--glycine ligase
MRVLIVGGGGREHALGWKLVREEPALELIAAPGNPGIAELGECVPIGATEIDALADLARARAVDFTLVGPEAALAAGIVDRFRAARLPVFGPTRAAAEIETSKSFAKHVMLHEGIPTARAEVHTDAQAAKQAVRRFGTPVVIKASGLAGGKGVIVTRTLDEADHAIDEMIAEDRFGAAGAEILVEEFMDGEELSLFAITDGTRFVVLPGLQDHKRLLDHDRGPNTGGMGAYLPVSIRNGADLSAAAYDDPAASIREAASEQIIAPALRALARRGRPFTGLLYAGLMITRDGPKVVEFNCRFGDPETQALMPALGTTRLLDMMRVVARGESLGEQPVPQPTMACVTTVLAAARYPGKPRLGDPITLPPVAGDDVIVFHAGTARDPEGRLVTAGGRVLAVSAVAPTVEQARERSLQHAAQIEFEGKQYRSDIGWREIARQQHPVRARASRN